MRNWQRRETDQQTMIGRANPFFKSRPLVDLLGRACLCELSKAWMMFELAPSVVCGQGS